MCRQRACSQASPNTCVHSLREQTPFINLTATQAQVCSPQPPVPALEASQTQQTHSCNCTQTADIPPARQSHQQCPDNQQAYKPGILHREAQVSTGQVALNGRRPRAARLSPGLAAPTGRLPRAAPTSPGPRVPSGPKLLSSLSLQSTSSPATPPPAISFHPTATGYPMGTWLLRHQ